MKHGLSLQSKLKSALGFHYKFPGFFFHSILGKAHKEIYPKLTKQILTHCWNFFKLMDLPG